MPDPGIDELAVIFYSFQGAGHDPSKLYDNGIISVENPQLNTQRLRDFKLDVVPNELELLNRLIDVVVELDPDIIAGWETQSASWGYLDGRAKQYGTPVILR